GPDHPELANTLRNLAYAFVAAARYDDGVAAGERLVAIEASNFGDAHVLTWKARGDLAWALAAGGDDDDSARAHATAAAVLPLLEKELGDKDFALVSPLTA